MSGASSNMNGLSGTNGNMTAPLARLQTVGPFTVFVTAEREHPGADPNRPRFLQGVTFDPQNPTPWDAVVLPLVRKSILNLASTSDVPFAGAMLSSPVLPKLNRNFRILELPNFYWFGGVNQDRPHNPYMQLARHLPDLRCIAIKMHTASITESAWPERRMIELETTESERARQLKCLSAAEVVTKYEINKLLDCRELREVHIHYIECERTRFFVRGGDPVEILGRIRDDLEHGFQQAGREVTVSLQRVD